VLHGAWSSASRTDHPLGSWSITGLGLALVKSLVELHGGSVEAWSDGPGTSSEFIVRLPVWDRDRLRNGSQPYAAGRDLHPTTVN
jgi:signal transduction histidine kinase